MSAIDIEDELRNWAAAVQWGDTGAPAHREVCGSAEKEYAYKLCRWQYESPPPRDEEPRLHDGLRIEKIVTHSEFPSLWRRVLVVHYIAHHDESFTIAHDHTMRQATRARAAGITDPNFYAECVDGAKAFIATLLEMPASARQARLEAKVVIRRGRAA